MGTCLIIKSGGGTDTSNATATADKILSGYTIYSNDNKITGTMINIGTQTVSGLNAGGSTTIKAGWHNGSGSVTTNSLSSQTGGTDIAASQVLNTYTYWSSGSKGTGTMTNRGTKAWTIGVNGSQTIESGWHSGSGTVKQSSTITQDTTWRMNTPGTSNKTICNSGWYYTQDQWCEGTTNLAAGNIKKGVSIFGVAGICTTNLYYIKDGKLQCSVRYGWLPGGTSGNSKESLSTGQSPYYDSSSKAFIVWGNNNNGCTYPIFTGASYPIINPTAKTVTGVIHVEFACVNPTHWASTGPGSGKIAYNGWWCNMWSSGLPSSITANTKYSGSFPTFSKAGTYSTEIASGAEVFFTFGRDAIGGAASTPVQTKVYNVWVDTAQTVAYS